MSNRRVKIPLNGEVSENKLGCVVSLTVNMRAAFHDRKQQTGTSNLSLEVRALGQGRADELP